MWISAKFYDAVIENFLNPPKQVKEIDPCVITSMLERVNSDITPSQANILACRAGLMDFKEVVRRHYFLTEEGKQFATQKGFRSPVYIEHKFPEYMGIITRQALEYTELKKLTKKD